MTYRISTRQLTETVAPTVEPVSLPEMKVHCRCEDTSDHDTILYIMVKAARQWVEREYQLSLVQRTYRADVPWFSGLYDLPLKPLSSVTSIKYYTDASPQVLTTLADTYYRADLGRGQIYLKADSAALPTPSTRHDAVQITYVAGFEPSTDSPQSLTANVPEAIKSTIKLLAADLFENRETNTQLKMQELKTTKMLMAPWREY